MKYIAVISSLLAFSLVNALPSTRNTRDISEECHPHFMHHPPHHRGPNDEAFGRGPPLPPPLCCELPDLLSGNREIFGQCHRFVHENFQNQNPGHTSVRRKFNPHVEPVRHKRDTEDAEEPNKEAPPRVDKFQEKKDCFMTCVFNMSGFNLADDMLNEELLNQKLTESIANESRWSPIVESVFKKCIAAAKEANSQSQKVCKSGPSEYMKCMNREFFFNCPAEMWNNSQQCTDIKEQLEKCPNLSPPPLHPHHPPHHHRTHHHHHHHRKHHKDSNEEKE